MRQPCVRIVIMPHIGWFNIISDLNANPLGSSAGHFAPCIQLSNPFTLPAQICAFDVHAVYLIIAWVF